MRTAISGALLSGLISVGMLAPLKAQCGEADFGPVLGHGDDVLFAKQPLGFAFPFAGGTYTFAHVSTNGFLYLSNGGTTLVGSGCCNVGVAQLVAGPPIVAPYWTDLRAVAGTGSVHLNTTIPGKAVITWKDVDEGVGTWPRTIQCQLFANGQVFFSYDDRAFFAAHTALVGCSPGGGAAVPAATDYSSFFQVGTTPTSYQLFVPSVIPFDLANHTLYLTPNGLQGWNSGAGLCPAGRNGSYGAGCYSVPGTDSVYSLFTDPLTWSAQLQGTAVRFVPNGTSYTMVSAGSYVAPTAAATPLQLPDDGAVLTPPLANPFRYPGGVTSQLWVCSNGQVAVTGGNSTNFVVNPVTMLNNPVTAWYSWNDYFPSSVGSGQVMFEQVGSVVYITWDSVALWGGAFGVDTFDTFQFQFDTTSGEVTIAWPMMTVPNGPTTQRLLVGYSPGGASPDPGSTDLATALPFNIPSAQRPLTLDADQALVAGQTTTFTVANVPELVPGAGLHLSVLIISPTPIPAPGLDLTALGLPGCALLANLDVLVSNLGPHPVAQFPVPVGPAMPPGTFLYAQGAALFTPGSLPNGQNAFGGVTSAGLGMISGTW